MTAIAALWNQHPAAPVQPALQTMLAALQSYGPDDTGLWCGPERAAEAHIGLGRTLLRTLPQESRDHQPLWTPDRSACLVAAVRLDNREALLDELGLSTAALAEPDAALLLSAWQRWGADCCNHLIGAFAFAVWTPARQELFAARDHTGEAPLFFHHGPGCFALSSMPKGLRTLPGVGTRFNEAWIADWLVSALHQEQSTLFTDIQTLHPGQFLRVTPGRDRPSVEIKRFWSPTDAPPVRFPRDQDYAEGLVEVLDRATAARLRRIGGAACQLSAGLDSSSVMASAATLLGRTGEPLRAYTSVPRPGFSAESYSKRPVIDEGPFAAEAAALYPNVTYVPFVTTGIPFLPTLEAFSDALDEPFLNGVNTLWITGIPRDARLHGCGVVLQGAAGNGTISFESLGVAAQWLRTGHWRKLLRHVRTLRAVGEMSYRNSGRAIWELAQPTSMQHKRWRQQGVTFDRGESLIHPQFVLDQQLAEKVLNYRLTNGAGYLVDKREFYRRVDIGRNNAASSALSGIALRDPTNDRRVWEYTSAIPPEQYAIDGHSRSLVRRAMRGRLPDATLDRYRAGRQGADWYMTFRDNLPELQAEVRLIAQCELATRILDVPKMQWLVDNFPTGGYGTIHVMNTWKYSLMRALSLGNYLRRHT